ncbi:hypothetical protein HYX02_01130 [Candidatus Woesearchaeota archaeon]|nr:hypothetical protein [Candidatus Woesearchaeota archaeon]
MKLFFILGEDAFFKPRFIESTIKKRKRDIAGIAVVSAKFPKSSLIKYLKKQLLFFGYLDFFILSALTIIYLTLDKLHNFLPLKRFYSVKSVAREYNIPLYLPKNVNDAEFIKKLKKSKPDIIVSSCPQIFKKELLNVPRIACINRHSSLLPQYGGLMPVFWAMLNDEKEVGVSIHKMVEHIDEGEVITQDRIKISDKDSLYDIYKKCFEISSGLVLEAIDILEQNKKHKIINKSRKKTYFSFPKREDIRLFRNKGKKFLTYKNLLDDF